MTSQPTAEPTTESMPESVTQSVTEPVSEPTSRPMPLRDRLRDALAVAIKARDRLSTSVLRATLGEIENAEAVPTETASGVTRPGSLAIEQSPVGVGAAEVARRVLTEDDVHAIVRAELAEREAAAGTCRRAGRPEQAERLQEEIEVLAAFLRL
ncbi:GatB/YqeY domain-containing protein [Streptacidiphilus neutrinimicus]|uniref:GatB/YqeY domain-containing protein n=1 Tax=Streptacidiphilus neutrinimicus TaxID=105420 RepID=UPI001F4143E8|nr:GatB/YqeY domain-containing protein [Streptacidiphilus neutrinimicus]